MFLWGLCGLDARTNDEMRAECHLIVKSLASSRNKPQPGCRRFVQGSTAANVFCRISLHVVRSYLIDASQNHAASELKHSEEVFSVTPISDD